MLHTIIFLNIYSFFFFVSLSLTTNFSNYLCVYVCAELYFITTVTQARVRACVCALYTLYMLFLSKCQ